METTLPLPFLPAIGSAISQEALSSDQLAYLGCVYYAAKPQETVDELLAFSQKHGVLDCFIDVRTLQSTDDIVSILNAGARKVFVTATQQSALTPYGDRVIPIFDFPNTPLASAYPNGVLVGGESLKSALAQLSAAKISPIYLLPSNDLRILSKETLQSFIATAEEFSAIPILPTTNLAIGAPSKDQVSIAELIAGAWTTDRQDKLVPTIVTDERGIALGLVYSSQESLAESLKTGNGVYQSRKRGLWYKGATSGDTQELVRISLDCDQDCLKFVVRQNGRGKTQTSAKVHLNSPNKSKTRFLPST